MDMEKIKGYRTAIATVIGAVLASIDGLRDVVMVISDFVSVEMGDGGAAAAIVAAITGIKAIIADVVPKVKGTLDK